MVDYDPHRWWHHLFDLRGSVVRQIIYRVLAVVLWSAAVVLGDRHIHSLNINQAATVHSLVGVALGLLLVFRTNASYDRFWEGRKLWGGMVNETRNLCRLARVLLGATSPDFQELVRWTISFPYSCMQRLRSRGGLGPIAADLPSAQREAVERAEHMPLAVSLELSGIIDKARRDGRIGEYHQGMLDQNVQLLIDYIGACERIHRTPLPFAYVVHLRRALLLYCLGLPVAIVGNFGWWSVPASFLVAYTFFGIEEIGVEIEDPFGTDENDLPLERICKGIEGNLRALLPSGS